MKGSFKHRHRADARSCIILFKSYLQEENNKFPHLRPPREVFVCLAEAGRGRVCHWAFSKTFLLNN